MFTLESCCVVEFTLMACAVKTPVRLRMDRWPVIVLTVLCSAAATFPKLAALFSSTPISSRYYLQARWLCKGCKSFNYGSLTFLQKVEFHHPYHSTNRRHHIAQSAIAINRGMGSTSPIQNPVGARHNNVRVVVLCLSQITKPRFKNCSILKYRTNITKGRSSI